MSIEPTIVFFIIRYLRNTLRIFSPQRNRDKQYTAAMYVVAVLFVAEIFLHFSNITIWFWHIVLWLMVAMVFLKEQFKPARKAMLAVIPLLVIALFDDITDTFFNSFYRRIEDFIEYAYLIAITWLIAMLTVSRKQQKTLIQDRKKAVEDEERRIFMENQRIELEVLVAERTAELSQQKEELQQALTELKATQAQLIQSEKMASLGELTAGIAHEIQNPLNFVNNFAEINNELIQELKSEKSKVHNERNEELENGLLTDIEQNLEKINHHGKRADAIVKGMLQHSRTNKGQKELTDINALADEYLRLSYHGLRAKDKSFNATFKSEFDESIGKVSIVPQDFGRLLLNLFNNAFYAVNEKKNLAGTKEQTYDPTVTVSTKKLTDKIEITVTDNGNGIPQKVLDKIFQPFYTTKPTGQGTGLGLSLSYDIIKAHGGEINIKTKEGEGSKFIILLPISLTQ